MQAPDKTYQESVAMMKLNTAAVANMVTPIRAAAAAAPAPMRSNVTRKHAAVAKPMAVSSSLHSPSQDERKVQKESKARVREISGRTPAQHRRLDPADSSEHTDFRSKDAKAGSSAAQATKLARRDRVVLEHLPLVKAIAVRVHENLPVHVDLDDLVHAGILGLFDAATKYNPDKQVAFSSYAKHRIKGAILDSLRQLDWASRDMRRRHKQVEAATRELAATLQRNPTEAEVAEKLGMDQDRWRSMMLDLRNVGLISASTRTNENEDLPAPDFPSNPETQPDSICAREQLRSVLGVAIKTLPERYQKVVSLYYTSEMTMKEIGGILGINESRVSQIHKAALEKMQVVLEANGISSSQAF
jgi:RNA polymerase sigma factor for flagellar operon FliA